MTLSHGFRRLANVLENLEANGLEVLDVATTDDDPSERLTVDLTVTVPTDLNASPPQSTLSDDDADGEAEASTATHDKTDESSNVVRERVLDSLSVRANATNGATAVETTDMEVTEGEGSESETADDETADDVVDCPITDCDATFESGHGMRIHRTKVHGDEDTDTDDGAPAYRDPDRLREVYAACNSFNEMREALETDVSAQTVRRQMIAHGIYEPGESGSTSPADDEDSEGTTENTSDDSADADAENDAEDENAAEEGNGADAENDHESELEAIELPEGVTVADLKAGVSSAQTLYDIQQRFELDREEAMQLLENYDLLDVVHGRVSNRDLRKQVDEDEITRRILEHAPVERPSQA